MLKRRTCGGIIHTYQHYDPTRFPSPTQPAADIVSHAFDHFLAFGHAHGLTPEQLANAVRLDPSQLKNLGPSIDALIAMLKERKRKILEKYETDTVQEAARFVYQRLGSDLNIPKKLRTRYQHAFLQEQLYQLERLWYAVGDERSLPARQLVRLVDSLGTKYEIDELAARYDFSGQTRLSIPKALEVKEELSRIDELLEQLEEARETAQIGVIDLDMLSEFVEPGDIQQLDGLRQMIDDLVREMAERQGLENADGVYHLTPKAYRLFQGHLLTRIFSQLKASKTGRHDGPIEGDGAVETQRTKPYEFGDSVTQMDITQSLVNAMVRSGPGVPLRMKPEDIEIHRTRNSPKCATVVIMDMSGSMRYDGQYVNVKRMALAFDGLIKSEFPGDHLSFIEMYSFARQCRAAEVVELLPKPVTIHDPIVQLKADMSNENISEFQIPPHFTNIQHSLRLARQILSVQDTPNRQIVLITDGLPTAHFNGPELFLLYPPDPRTESATLREGLLCQRDDITINLFLVPSWSQTEEDVRFAHRLAETTSGRVFFTAGGDLDRFVVWDYVRQKREIVA